MSQVPCCRYFGQCGGCSFQDVAYPEAQIESKKKYLKALLGREVEIIPSPIAYGYRNRMDFVCAFSKIGLRQRRRFNEVVDLEECHLINNKFLPLFRELRAAAKESGIRDFNYLNHEGYLRYMVFRLSANAPDMMVSFVTATADEAVLPLLALAEKKATSVNWLINGGLADLSYGPVHQWRNSPVITEKIGKYSYRIGPNTFFQNNGFLAEKLFDHVKAEIKGTTLDLFCGAGAISVYVADAADSVIGVEREEDSLRLAREAAELNAVRNVSFISADAAVWLRENEKSREYQTIIIDPPRAGLGGKTARKILRMGAEKIVYVSCNPVSFRGDLAFLSNSYALESVMGFDMFPQTPHVEVVGVMKRNGTAGT
jgi:23S rRNA (uracil-5-)-methyltransferase RumA